MDLEDDTTIFKTLKSLNTFISRPEHPQRPSEQLGIGNLQSHYKRSFEILEATERVHSQHRYLQLDQEKQQMELSHKRARFELEKAASDSARDLEVQKNFSVYMQKIEDLEKERQRLEEQNNILEMRLERHNLQGDYDPVKTQVVHLKLNPTTEAKQQRQKEVEDVREELNRLRELVRSFQEGGMVAQDDSRIHTSGLNLRKQMESSELRNQRLKEVFQKKIQEFRTVCYVLTGYQIDITTENQYRLTSAYAEHMQDSLLFKKIYGPGSNGSMQLMETEFSKTLGEMVNLHLHHQKSIPAFLSAVTLDLFSRQTVF
uniref:Mitotic spindle assembly checkpoint protein MAD1 n=1 Tax=Fundulus heteroclitus TaxID=8078 RepID=A0A3Q2SUS1_FUNHE